MVPNSCMGEFCPIHLTRSTSLNFEKPICMKGATTQSLTKLNEIINFPEAAYFVLLQKRLSNYENTFIFLI